MLDILMKAAYLSAILLSLYISGWLMAKANRNSITGALAGCQFLIIIWCIPQLFYSFPMTKELKYLMYGISYIGISFIGPAWLTFVFLYSQKKISRGVLIVLFGFAAINYSILLTNEYHYLFYRSFEVEGVVYGPVFYLHMGFTYLCVLGGIVVVLKAFRRNLVAPVHITVILLAALVPLFFNILYMTGLVRTQFDLTPLAFAFSNLFMLLAVFRYDFLDVNAMAFEEIFDTISEGVAIYNRSGNITYCNHAVSKWFRVHPGDEMNVIFDRLEQSGITIGDEGNDSQKEPVLELGEGQDQKKLEIRHYSYHDKTGRLVAHALMFTDVAKYYQLLAQGAELAVSHQRLAIEQERNRIAQEVHDTTGHTLTMINSLLKLSGIEYRKEDNRPESQISEYLSQAQDLAKQGIRELRCSINNLRQAADTSLITQALQQLAQSVKEIDVEVKIQGDDKPEYSHLSPVVYACAREAVTNCLKYADASHLDIILKFADSFLNLYIFDDGKGCSDIQDGNGIRGIRERVKTAGGEMRVISEAGEGFQISIRFPL